MSAFVARCRRGWLALVLVLGVAGALPARAHATPDARELQAREDFAAGRYQTALEIFARLYAETLHPNYLRNIGRCYQNLGEPDRAITSFRDYLHKGKNISADERAEIDGYIKDMQDLKQRNAAKPAVEAPRVVPLAPAPAVAPAPRPTAASLTLTAPPPAPAREEEPPVYERWWFWAVVAGVVGTGLGVAAATGAFTHYNDAPCGGRTCGQ